METSGEAGSSAATRERLERELAQAREERRRLAVQLGGEDPDDPDRGDRGDEAFQLEGLDDLARMDRRIDELQRLLAGQGAPPGLAEGTVVTLRFPDGEETTFRIVTIPEQAPATGQDDVVTADSPLGRALVGQRAGSTVTYQGPDGELRAEVVAVQAP